MIFDRSPLKAFLRASGASSPYSKLNTSLYEAQKPYVLDPVGHRCNHSGRRHGKSRANGVILLKPARNNPNGMAFFAAPTSKDAKRILWTTLYELDSEFNLGLKFNGSELTVKAPNGYTVWLTGIKDKHEANKLRGSTHGFCVGIFDECAFIPDDTLKWAVVDCAMPALGENKGNVYLTGTPGPLKKGFYYEKCQEWPTYSGDARTNPKMGEEYLLKALADNNWTWDHPTFRREYLGEWVEDESILIYRYNPNINMIYPGSEFPAGRTILGVDIGRKDGCGFTVTRSQPPNNPDVHILCSYEKLNMTTPTIMREIEVLKVKYDIQYVFVDQGGLGQMIADTWWIHHGLFVLPAPKGHKRPRIEVVRAWLVNGTLKLLKGECDQLITEWQMMTWNDKLTDHDPRFSDECSDSAIYSMLYHRGYYEKELLEAERGTKAYEIQKDQAEKERDEEAAEEEFRGGKKEEEIWGL